MRVSIEELNAARERAKGREEGGSTVKVFTTSSAMHAHRGEFYGPSDVYKQHLHEARMDCYAAVEFALFAHTWEGLEP